MRATLGTVALLVCLALPSVALAHRAPNGAESKAIRTAMNVYIKNPSSHAASDNKVVKITVSTADTRFAAAKLTSVSGNSMSLLERAGSRWKVLGFGSSANYCKIHPPKGAVAFNQMLEDLGFLPCSG